MDIYDGLCDVYEMGHSDLEKIIPSIANKLTDRIPKVDQALLVLRFMEFSSQNREEYIKQRFLFEKVANTFNVEAKTFEDFDSFIQSKKSENVGVESIEGSDYVLRVLRLLNIIR